MTEQVQSLDSAERVPRNDGLYKEQIAARWRPELARARFRRVETSGAARDLQSSARSGIRSPPRDRHTRAGAT